MSQSMLKQVAAAICERRNAADWPCNGLDFDEEMAKTAFKAMREPTQEMIENCFGKGMYPSFKTAWYAMIDTAINEK